MKRRELDDRQMKILLGDYRRPSLKPEALAALAAAADALDRKPPKVVQPVFGGWVVRAVSLAAGLVLVLGIAALFLLRGPAAGQGLSAVALDGQRTALPAVTRLEASADTQFVEAPGQQVALAGGSVLDIDASDPSSIHYRLESGNLRLRHGTEGIPPTADFVLGFPGGQVWPLGTELTIQILRGETRVWCLEGALAFQPDAGTGSRATDSKTESGAGAGQDGDTAPGSASTDLSGLLKIRAGQVLVVTLEGSTEIKNFGSDSTGPAPQMLPMSPWDAGAGQDQGHVPVPGATDVDQSAGEAPGSPAPAGPAGAVEATGAPGATGATRPANQAIQTIQASPSPGALQTGSPAAGQTATQTARTKVAPLPAPTRSAPAARVVWTRTAPAGTLALALRGAAVVALAPDGITTLKASDGSDIARVPLAAKPASWAVTDSLVILYEARTLTAWRLPGLKPAWTAATGNLAFTDLSLGKDLAYLPSAEGKLYQHRLSDGSLSASPDLGSGSYGRVLESPGRLTVSTLTKELVNLEAATGSRIWTASLPFRPVDDQPLALDSLIIEASPEGLILALDAATGTKAWEFRLPGALKGRMLISQGHIVLKTASRVWLVDSHGKGRALADSDLDLLGATGSGSLVLGGKTGLVLLRQDGSTTVLAPQAVVSAANASSGRLVGSNSPDQSGKSPAAALPAAPETWAVLGSDGQIRLLEITP